jgi:hypothetical protein
MTGRASSSANALVNRALNEHGMTITTRQIETWTRKRLAPSLPRSIQTPLPERVVRYYCELSTIAKQGRKTVGILATMAFRGYSDLIEVGALRTDLQNLIQPRLIPESYDDDSRREKALRSIERTRRRDNPARASMVQGLRALPAEMLDGRALPDRMDVTAFEAGERLLDGGEFGIGEEIIASLHSAAGTELEQFIGPTSSSSLTWAAERLNGLRLDDLQETIEAVSIENVVSIARVLYPLHAYIAPYLSDLHDTAGLQQNCMVAAVFMANELSLTGLELLNKLTADLAARRPDLRVHASGVDHDHQTT